MQTAEHQAFTDSTTVKYPPAWDTTTGPTVTRTFHGTVATQFGVPGSVPVQYPQSFGADIAPLLARIRESYRDVGTSVEAFPATPIAVVQASARVAERDLGDARTAGLAVIASVAVLVLIAHLWLTSRALRALRRRVARMQRRGLAASAPTPPPA